MPAIDVIIVAAGSGLRFGAPLPKQFCLLAGRPVLMHTISAFHRFLPQADITLVISADMSDLWKNLCLEYDFLSPTTIAGGSTRWESIHNAVKWLYPDDITDNRIVLVHDGVRPLIDNGTIKRLVKAINDNPDAHGVIPSVNLTDSIRQIKNDGSSYALNRECLRAVQTPQVFRAKLLREAYSHPYKSSFTDDASVMEDAGYTNLILCEGSHTNIKITTPGDIDIAEILLERLSVK